MRLGIFRKSHLEAEPCPESEHTHFNNVLDTQGPGCWHRAWSIATSTVFTFLSVTNGF